MGMLFNFDQLLGMHTVSCNLNFPVSAMIKAVIKFLKIDNTLINKERCLKVVSGHTSDAKEVQLCIPHNVAVLPH